MNETMNETAGTLLLSRREVAALLPLGDVVDAVEAAFRAHAAGATVPPGVLGAHLPGGGFHLKTAGVGRWFAAKLNGNFRDNAARFGLPRIQGLVVLADARHGYPLAVMDSIEITALRTAAATAVAARHLARRGAATATIVGCGVQGRMHVRALRHVLPLATVHAVDADAGAATRFAVEMRSETGIAVAVAADLGDAARGSDVVVTCTPAAAPLLGPGDVRPGAFVAAVGADAPEKQELAPALLAAARVVVDDLGQCLAMGDLRHAVAAGAMTAADVHATLAEVVAGRRPGRVADEEVFVFDSTGVALEDVAAAALAYERAVAAGVGRRIDLLGA